MTRKEISASSVFICLATFVLFKAMKRLLQFGRFKIRSVHTHAHIAKCLLKVAIVPWEVGLYENFHTILAALLFFLHYHTTYVCFTFSKDAFLYEFR